MKDWLELIKPWNKRVLSDGDNLYIPFYARNPTFSSVGNIRYKDEYQILFRLYAPDLDTVFNYMQGEVWSPHGEARELIRSLELRHTSMSVGDVILDYEKNTWWMVDYIGFKQIKMLV